MGTAMTNRKQYPKELCQVKLKNRGDSAFRYQGNIVCLAWKDRKPIHFISSCHDPQHNQSVLRRNKDGSQIEISIPSLVKEYNMFMEETDKNDQMTRLHKTKQHYRWPRRLLVKFIMWAVYNSYVIFQFLYPEKAKNCTFRKYFEQYSLELVGEFRTQAVRRVRAVGDEVRLQNVGLHHLCIPEDGSKVTLCVVCSKKYSKFKKAHRNVAYKDCPVKAVKSAMFCQEHLCVKRGSTCWSDWHTKVEC
ncbi:hypothetical protein RRG08_046774 [Elysia crispata]|uniref:PiggyBac transposable element-derived protein domain-containing protein n=1 Tax=Elysia crispata TaxID=231223 RepID=A0AAE0ZVG6_9GAST|nr:hypothetical protein RRG08_046774 [Elysia crispata]